MHELNLSLKLSFKTGQLVYIVGNKLELLFLEELELLGLVVQVNGCKL